MPKQCNAENSITGVGVSARAPHLPLILQQKPNIAWFELLVDNCFAKGGLDYHMFEALAAHYPVVLHGVQLSLGSYDGIDVDYIQRVVDLKKRLNGVWYSEHCSFSGFQSARTPDLLPMPYTKESMALLLKHIDQVQQLIQEPLRLENISYYHHTHPEQEAEFFAELVQRSGCRILLDVNNIFVNSVNFSFCPQAFVKAIPLDKVDQIHVAGHTKEVVDGKVRLIDTHSGPATDEVLCLLEFTLKACLAEPRSNLPSVNIEWDAQIPDWPMIMLEVDKISVVMDKVRLPPVIVEA